MSIELTSQQKSSVKRSLKSLIEKSEDAAIVSGAEVILDEINEGTLSAEAEQFVSAKGNDRAKIAGRYGDKLAGIEPEPELFADDAVSTEDAPGLPNDAENDVEFELADEPVAEAPKTEKKAKAPKAPKKAKPEPEPVVEPEFAVELSYAEDGPAKHYRKALARVGALYVADQVDVLYKWDEATQTVELSGDDEKELDRAADIILGIWTDADEARKEYVKTDEDYRAVPALDNAGKKARHGLAEAFLIEFSRGYADAALGNPVKGKGRTSAGFKAGVNAFHAEPVAEVAELVEQDAPEADEQDA